MRGSSEILKLAWAQVDFRNRLVHVIKTTRNKNRVIPMNNVMYKTLQELRAEANGSERVYQSKHVQSKHIVGLGFPLAVLVLSLGVVARLEGQFNMRQSQNACPVIADLFPTQVRSADVLRYIFPENMEIPLDKAGDLSKVAQRISIALLAPGGEEIELTFSWRSAVFINPRIEWGEYSGSFLVKGNGKPNCFFLGHSAGLPMNIPCAEFYFSIPPAVEIKEVLFSSLACEEYSPEDCPMPGLERQIGEAFIASLRTPQDNAKTRKFISLLEEAIPEYGCFTRDAGHPVPALFLADLASIWHWLDYLYQKMDEMNDDALRVFAGIYDKHPDGVLSEVMADHIEKILHDRPLFILNNWPEIRTYKRNILESRGLWGLTGITGLIAIYSDIGRKEPKYKAYCDEIIRILDEKGNKNYEVSRSSR